MPPPKSETPPNAETLEGAKKESLAGVSRTDSTTPDVEKRLLRRYRLDGQIKRVLKADARRIAADQYPWKIHRQTGCTWVPVANAVGMRKSLASGNHSYTGLATCGSVWVCPNCSSKIQERRRLEIVQAIAAMGADGYSPIMVSFTFPHRHSDNLASLLALQQRAIKSMRESWAYKSLMAQMGCAGRIRALEITHGLNGFHPHTHELLFVKNSIDAAEIRHALAAIWVKASRRVGLFRPEIHDATAFLEYGVDVQIADAGVGAYLAKFDDQSKWGISHEMSKSSSKQGRKSGLHPFELVEEKPQAFLEYVHAMKNQRQLVWSRGLKSRCLVEEKTDDQIAEENTDIRESSFHLPAGSWRWILGNDARGEVLMIANRGGAAAVLEFLQKLGYEISPDIVVT